MKTCCSCTALLGFAAESATTRLTCLPKTPFGHLGRDLLDQVVALIQVFDRKLHALELILALNGVGAGSGNGRPDRDRVAL